MTNPDAMPSHDAEGHSDPAGKPAQFGLSRCAPRALFLGLPRFDGSFAEDLMQELMASSPRIEVIAVTTPAPQHFQAKGAFKSVEFIQKDDFEFFERIDRLSERHNFRLSRQVLEQHTRSEYKFLSISDRRTMYGAPVFKRRHAFRRLLAYWHHFLLSRRIDVVIIVGYPHAGWNNVLADVAQGLSIPVILLDFTVISGTTLVGNLERLQEKVPEGQYDQFTNEDLYEAIPAGLRERIAAPLFGQDFSSKVKLEVQTESRAPSYLSLLRGILRNPLRRIRPSFARLSGDVSQLAMTLYTFESKRHVAELHQLYRSISTSEPNLAKPFIYFPLHMQPERSTTPAGGVFEDQLLVAEILADALPEGWSLYIKEHPSQFWQRRAPKQAWYRDAAYYDRMRTLPNTQLISLDYDSQKLINSAAAVATITGTAGWECLTANKGCIAFGAPWYAGCRACHVIGSVDECKAAIEAIANTPAREVQRAVLELLVHYSDRIIPVAFLPDRNELSPKAYEEATASLLDAVLHATLSSVAQASDSRHSTQ